MVEKRDSSLDSYQQQSGQMFNIQFDLHLYWLNRLEYQKDILRYWDQDVLLF
jgi:hypothetical protein